MKDGDSSNESTISAELRPLRAGLPFLELHGRGRFGLRRIPFLDSRIQFHPEEDREQSQCWLVEMKPDTTFLFYPESQPTRTFERLLEEPMELGGERWMVVDTRAMPGHCLAALSPELSYRTWPLGSGQWNVGRSGRRHNHIALEHKSISRLHARIKVEGEQATLTAETDGALTAVNEVPLVPNRPVSLSSQDLVQFGQLLFRWESHKATTGPLARRLRIKTLGRAEISLEGVPTEPLRFSNDNAKSLLLRLVAARGTPVLLERLLEEYWPERPSLRQRKNLSHTLRALQAELGWTDEEYERRLERHPETLILRTDCVAWCDLWTLTDTLRAPRSARVLDALHPGAFLPNYSYSWTRSLRAELFLSWLSGLKQNKPSDLSGATVGESLTTTLREAEFEEDIYREVIAFAQEWQLTHLIPIWINDLEERLRHTTGDSLSPELAAFARLRGELS